MTPHPSHPNAELMRMRHRRQLVLKYTIAGFAPMQIQKLYNEEIRKMFPGQPELEVELFTIKEDRRHMLRELAKETKEDIEDYRAMIIQRYEVVLQTLYPMVKNGHLGAIDRWLRTNDQLATVTGANAPIKVEVEDKGKLTLDERKQRVLELLNTAAERAAQRAMEYAAANQGEVIDVTPLLPGHEQSAD